MSIWKKTFTENEIRKILEIINRNRFVIDNKVTIKNDLAFTEYCIMILTSAINIETETEAFKRKILRKSIFSNNTNGTLTIENLSKEIYKNINNANSTKILYRIAFPVWNKPDFLFGKRRINNVFVNFSPSKNTKIFKRIFENRTSQRKQWHLRSFFTSEISEKLDECAICLARVHASSPEDANEQASEAIYSILGLVNLAIDKNTLWRRSSGIDGKHPVSNVLIAPHTTTHFEDGSLTHDGFWYEDWVDVSKAPKLPEKKTDAWSRRYNRLAQHASRSPWREKCRVATAQYYKAFANPNLEKAFLDGWRLFETVAGPENEKTEKKIDRVSKIYESSLEYKIYGKYLYQIRNKLTHGNAIGIDEYENFAYLILQFLGPFIEYYIWNGLSFSSEQEFWEFLDLPREEKDREQIKININKQKKLLDIAAKFRREIE